MLSFRSTKEEVMREVKDKAITLYMAEWIVWPTAQIINFTILPTKYRVSFSCEDLYTLPLTRLFFSGPL